MKKKSFNPTLSLSALFIASTLSAAPAPTSPAEPVSREQFNQVIRVLKKTMDRVQELESHSTVDLNKLGPHGASTAGAPNFKVYFDLNLVNRPGIANFTFQNYHSLLMFEMIPSPELQFTFEINPSPRYYELDYQLSPKLQLRAGKIWIPFDDLNPHNIFGGRINNSRLSSTPSSSTAFLPDLWTELGVGLKYQAIETQALKVEGHAYIVNGFGSGGSDPMGLAPSYPSFGETSIAAMDNNRDKAIGLRGHALYNNFIGVGASYYRGRWSDDSSNPDEASQGLSILGLDSQLRLSRTGTEIRLGYASMSVDLFDSSFNRGGLYAEVGQKFGRGERWKFLFRAGEVQLDNRVIAVSDQQIVGGTLLYNPGMIQYSIEHSFDLETIPGKVNMQYTALRLIVAL